MRLRALLLVVCLLSVVGTPFVVQAETTRTEQRQFNASIIDRSKQLNRRFKKVPRKSTKYIIVHTAEAGHANTLRVVSQGKRLHGGRRTYGGHAHYVIGRDVGLSGTPAIVFSDGTLIAGYLPPDQLAARLEQNATK